MAFGSFTHDLLSLGLLREAVRNGPRALPLLRPARHGLAEAGPSGQEPEGVADAEERAVAPFEKGVEEAPERGLPRRVLGDPLREGRDPVVLAGVEGARSARADDEGEAVGARRDREAAPDVVRDHADLGSASAEPLALLRADPLETPDDRGVPEVRKSVVHVEDGHVEERALRRRLLPGTFDPGVRQVPSSLSERVMRRETASRGAVVPSRIDMTVSEIGISTPTVRASSTMAPAVGTPSAT